MEKSFNIKSSFKAFTIIELMVGIFVTIIAIGTFFKLYTNSVKAERSTNLRSSVSLLGDQIIENISNSIRLLGLNSDYADFNLGTIITASDGGAGGETVTFNFFSPYGGPITQLSADAVAAGAGCTFSITGSSALHAGLASVQLMTQGGVYVGTGLSFPANAITSATIVDSAGAAFAGDCATAFPKGTLLTGPNNEYQLKYINGGATTSITLHNASTGENVVNFSSDATTAYKVPFFVFQFLREYEIAGVLRREWVTDITDPIELQQVKAIRIGFVMLSTRDRTKKKVSTAGLGTTIDFCPFDGMCYSLNDLNKTAYVFRRVIHIRNFDYLQRNSEIEY